MTEEITKFGEIQPAIITADFGAMGKKLDNLLKPYDGMTAEAIAKMNFSDMKLCRKDLNAIVKSVEDGRKGVKREYNKPLADFESQCKQLLEPANQTLKLFKDAIAIEERDYQLAKRNELLTDWHGIAGEIAELVDFATILNPSWLNRSFLVTKADNEMGEIAGKIIADRRTLKNQNLKHLAECDLFYCQTLDLQKTLDYDAQLTAKAEEAAKHQEQSARIEGAKTVRTAPQEAEPVKKWTLSISATRSQIGQLTTYLKDLGIHGEVKTCKE